MRGIAWVLVLGVAACHAGASPTSRVTLKYPQDATAVLAITRKLQQVPGMRQVHISNVVITMVTQQPIDARRVFEQAIAELKSGADHSANRELPSPKYPASADLNFAPDGFSDPAELSVAGKYTIVDFFADWCAPCKQLDYHLILLVGKRENVAIRKVLWHDSPMLKKFGVPMIPTLMVYGPDRKLISTVTGLDLAALDRALGVR
jgi:thiol-disulfide isomerase/thioredoxin